MPTKAHLTSHFSMSGSRWMITPSWLSGSLRPFGIQAQGWNCQVMCFLVVSRTWKNYFPSWLLPVSFPRKGRRVLFHACPAFPPLLMCRQFGDAHCDCCREIPCWIDLQYWKYVLFKKTKQEKKQYALNLNWLLDIGFPHIRPLFSSFLWPAGDNSFLAGVLDSPSGLVNMKRPEAPLWHL